MEVEAHEDTTKSFIGNRFNARIKTEIINGKAEEVLEILIFSIKGHVSLMPYTTFIDSVPANSMSGPAMGDTYIVTFTKPFPEGTLRIMEGERIIFQSEFKFPKGFLKHENK